MAKDPDKYSDKEARLRFEAALRGGLSAPPQHRTKKAKQKKRKKRA